MKQRMTMLILSCDKFSDLWDGHVKLLEQNWPDRNMDTIIVTDKQRQVSYQNVRVFAAGEELEWSERLEKILDSISTDYVFLTLDDYYLIKKVNTQSIKNMLNLMEETNLDYIRLFKRPTRATREEISECKGVFKIDPGSKYSVNLYSGIWRKKFLSACIGDPMNAWQFEVNLPAEAVKYGAECAVSLNNDFVILDVVRKGKMLHRAYYYFEKHPGIYNGNRDVNTWGYEIRLGIKTIVGRYTPRPIHYAIKRVMRKLGYQFYSE